MGTKEKVTWRVGKGEIHSIPEKAVVSIIGKTTTLVALIDNDGEVTFYSTKKGKTHDKVQKRK